MQESPPIIVGLGEVLWDMLPAGRQLGGAPANFAYHAHALRARGVVASCIGADPAGVEILEQLKSVGAATLIATDVAHPTGRVGVRLDAEGVPSYVIHEPVAWDFIPQTESLTDLARQSDAVCFGSLAQRSPVSRETINAFLKATRVNCLRVFDINLRQHYYSRAVVHESLLNSTVLKLNDEELPVVGELLGYEDVTSETVPARLLADYPLQLIALTRGTRGSVLFSRDQTIEHPGFPTTVADTVGAGDAFTAALVTGLLNGDDLERINIHANRLASYVCSQHGAMPPIPLELIENR